MSKTILEMRDVSKSFGATKALKNVSIELKEQEILAICGENGAGKSTLMKVLSGSYDVSTYSGEIWIDGKKCVFHSPADSSAAGIEMIYQEISVHLDLSVAENIFLGRIPTKHSIVRWPQMYEEAKRYAEMVGLKMPVTTHLRDLSASQCQMVSIARALSRKPKILVLDEPTSPLTETEVEELFKILFELREQGISCIYISHKIREIKRLANRVSIMRDGNHVWTKPAKEVEVEDIVEAMVNRKIGNMYPKESVPIGDEVFSVKNLRVKHPYNRKKNVVDGVDISVHKGEILGLVGLVGAGRSETVNAIFGAISGTYDEMRIDGKLTTIKDPGDAIHKGLALLSEDRKVNGFIPMMDIAQNISLACLEKVSHNGILKKECEDAYGKEYMDLLSIKANSTHDMLTSLSGGNQQKVVLSKWLMVNPKVLLLDEPTRGIDVGAKNQIYQTMTLLAQKGMAIIMISSELQELVGMCDRYLLLADGKIRAELLHEEADEERFLRICSGG
ncbi:MAG: sugar ABC transporter ATP-binding protein [Clostridia bacterium]